MPDSARETTKLFLILEVSSVAHEWYVGRPATTDQNGAGRTTLVPAFKANSN
jgi:hypothetical protein